MRYDGQVLLCCGDCTIAYSGQGAKRDIHEIGGYLGDTTLLKCPEPGLWVWEGTINWSEEVPVYIGEWRRPTEDELRVIAGGGMPWPDGDYVAAV